MEVSVGMCLFSILKRVYSRLKMLTVPFFPCWIFLSSYSFHLAWAAAISGALV